MQGVRGWAGGLWGEKHSLKCELLTMKFYVLLMFLLSSYLCADARNSPKG
jgi:hypothetical protein